MSKPRYDWWSYVKGMIRRYPEMHAEYTELHRQNVTQPLSGMPGGGNISRSAEAAAIRELPGTRQREYNAVYNAIEQTKKIPWSGELRLQLISLVFWQRSHTLEGAALACNCSYRTARRYHSDFIMAVALFYGLLDE